MLLIWVIYIGPYIFGPLILPDGFLLLYNRMPRPLPSYRIAKKKAPTIPYRLGPLVVSGGRMKSQGKSQFRFLSLSRVVDTIRRSFHYSNASPYSCSTVCSIYTIVCAGYGFGGCLFRFWSFTFKPVCFVNHRFSTFQSLPSTSANEICVFC